MSFRTYIYSFLIIALLSSCGSHKISTERLYDPVEVSQLSRKLGIPLANTNKDDDKCMPLYAEVSLWLGVPYKYGGMSVHGLDCSAFTYLVYKKVYGKILPRSTAELSKAKMKKVSKSGLKAGDLVFFATMGNKKKITHTGIYLKEGYFIHASTSKGVTVSHLEENYYKKAWRRGGRIK